MKAFICGSGRLLYFLGRAFLAKGYTVTLVTEDSGEAAELARRLNATVVHGDGSDPGMIEEAGASDTDVVVAALPHDHDNLAICQIASLRFGVPHALALVNDPDNEEVFSKLGVSAVSATRIMIDVIERRAAHGEISKMLPLGEGKLSLAEVDIDSDAPVAGERVADVALPSTALLVCVLRGQEAIIPHGDTVLEVGDRVVVITSPERHGETLRVLTGGDR
ncbi:MAG TPA: TrkA family potassium uptake protein [Candidatus Hydrogenedentes bacterium]|nr:TrkA family potassium uptake protein [Candidatus Hydrogenedentota bacterium]HPG69859.1 TrkA family potassium uptake protein [Candidatus Hydrogenedentota bacterium]